jgi:hypothetical protein
MRLTAAPSAAPHRKLHDERAALPRAVALDEDLSAVVRDDRSHDEQAEAGAFDARAHRAGNPIEPLEDALPLDGEIPIPLIADAQRHRRGIGLLELDGDAHGRPLNT